MVSPITTSAQAVADALKAHEDAFSDLAAQVSTLPECVALGRTLAVLHGRLAQLAEVLAHRIVEPTDSSAGSSGVVAFSGGTNDKNNPGTGVGG